MSLPISELQDFFNQDIPLPRKRETTIFDIAGFPHYENVMSSCYAHFLNQEAGDQLSGVFMDTLLQLIREQTGKVLSYQKWEAKTEVTTRSGKRIDILIAPPKDEKGPHIIIENKIFHWLHNDLADYWNYCDVSHDQKAGIVLSLTKTEIPSPFQDKFINILHSEWTDAINAALDKSALQDKSQVYINDFFTALDNLKIDIDMNEQTRFFFTNTKKVNAVIKTKNAAYDYVIQQIRAAAEKLEYSFSGSAYDYRYIEVPELVGTGVYYTLMFNNLFTEKPEMRVVIELQAKVRHRTGEFDEALSETVKKLGLMEKPEEHRNAWLHYVGKDYRFSEEELNNLGELLANHIRNDFEPIMKEIAKIIK